MARIEDSISEELSRWLEDQRVFFVATSPLSAEGHVNVSPKGGDSFRVLSPTEVAYQDYTGSGAETAAHVRENGRIVLMFCAFEGKPQIVRLHGRGSVLALDSDEYRAVAPRFPESLGARAIIKIDITRCAYSCGYSIPLYEHQGPREVLDAWAAKKGAEGLAEYRAEKNRRSIDGLPALD